MPNWWRMKKIKKPQTRMREESNGSYNENKARISTCIKKKKAGDVQSSFWEFLSLTNCFHLERRYIDKYVFNLIWREKKKKRTGVTLIPPITVNQNNSPTRAPTQQPNQYERDQNQLQSSCCRKKDIKFIQTSICAQAEFLPLHYPELWAARSLRRWLCHKTAWPGPTFMNEVAGFFQM